MKRIACLVSLIFVAGCTDQPTLPSSALSMPIDFSYACEGAGTTVAPENDERVADASLTRMCPDIALSGGGTAQGAMIGLVLNQSPAGVNVVQMNPAAGDVTILDADKFIPGFSSIPVGEAPIRILRASDWGSFYVISAGDQQVSRLVIKSLTGQITIEKTDFQLPGVPSDGLVVGDTLWVTSSDRPELWLFQLAPFDTQPYVIALPDVMHRISAAQDGRLVATWRSRPVISLLAGDGTILDEQSLAPACRDTLDNDGDGLADKDDPDCTHPDHGREDAETVEPLAATEPTDSFKGTDLCADGVDNDGDGQVDGADDSCAEGAAGEGVSQCADGIDNDGDGQTDGDDASCYAETNLKEGALPTSGPFFATTVHSKGAGNFVYVFDQNEARFVVFGLNETTMTRVSVTGTETLVPALTYRTYGSDTTTTLGEVRGAAYPALAYQGLEDLIVASGMSLNGLTASPVPGEVWQRNIAPGPNGTRAEIPEGLSSDSYYIPTGCDPANTDVCVQPEGDDDTHYVMGPRLDGSIQLVQAVYRGEARHRFAQKTNDPSLRTYSIGQPQLVVRGDAVTLGNALPEGAPFLGPVIFEQIQEMLSTVQPKLERQYGIWPPEDPEQAPTETWSLTYEGVVPGTDSVLGRMVNDTTFVAPGQRFCELGVQIGDYLTLTTVPGQVDPALHYPLELTTTDGKSCATLPPERVQVEVLVTEVGQAQLIVDPSSARRVPQMPVLDSNAIEDGDLSDCEAALADAEEAWTRSNGSLDFEPTDVFSASALPSRLMYAVRARDAWVVEGTLTGYVHPWFWDGSQCVQDTELSPLLTGRASTASLVGEAYATCPPEQNTLGIESLESIVDTASRFANYSFKLDIMPGCVNGPTGVEMVGPQRDTRWSFDLNGPDDPATISYSGIGLSPRLSTFEFRRQMIHLDTSGNRISVLTVLPALNSGSFSPTFE